MTLYRYPWRWFCSLVLVALGLLFGGLLFCEFTSEWQGVYVGTRAFTDSEGDTYYRHIVRINGYERCAPGGTFSGLQVTPGMPLEKQPFTFRVQHAPSGWNTGFARLEGLVEFTLAAALLVWIGRWLNGRAHEHIVVDTAAGVLRREPAGETYPLRGAKVSVIEREDDDSKSWEVVVQGAALQPITVYNAMTQTGAHATAADLRVYIEGLAVLDGPARTERRPALKPVQPIVRTLPRVRLTPTPAVVHAGECLVCGGAFQKVAVLCPRCATPHHDDCWEYAGRCAIYGCNGGVAA